MLQRFSFYLLIVLIGAVFSCYARGRKLDAAVERFYQKNPHLKDGDENLLDMVSMKSLYHMIDCILISYSGYVLYGLYMTPQEKDSTWVGYYMPESMYAWNRSASMVIFTAKVVAYRVALFRVLDGIYRYGYKPSAWLCGYE